MSRVYLMADFGGAAPKLIAHRAPTFATPDEWRAMIEINNGRFSNSTRKTRRAPGFWSALERVAKARAWWLVEAESADAARECIALDEACAAQSSRYRMGDGSEARILASGGAK